VHGWNLYFRAQRTFEFEVARLRSYRNLIAAVVWAWRVLLCFDGWELCAMFITKCYFYVLLTFAAVLVADLCDAQSWRERKVWH